MADIKAERYDCITIDLDNYQIKHFIKNYDKVIKEIKNLDFTLFRVFESKKGFNIYINLDRDISFNELMFYRLKFFDDVFRLRADILKYYKGQYHRINRLWTVKDGYKKKCILDIQHKSLIDNVTSFKKILEDKKKDLEEIKKVVKNE